MGKINSTLKENILNFCEGDLANVTNSIHIRAFHRGRLHTDLQMGKGYDYYDLASLTKIFFTTLGYMQLVKTSPRILRCTFSKIDTQFKASLVTPFELLTHTAGLPWWSPFYKNLRGESRHDLRWAQLKKALSEIKPKKRKKAIYSDVDFLFLGVALENFKKKSLIEIWEEMHSDLALGELHFNINNKPKFRRSSYAPTESCPWRKKILQGEVHDDNTWALGGIAPQAGLFGSIDDVTQLCLRLRKIYRGGSDKIATPEILHRFTRRQTPVTVGDWGLGFMLPTGGRASSGQYFSSRSFGHTGFTGTSFWYDPKDDWLVVVLSNRVYPTRENKKFVALRPLIHDWLRQAKNIV